MCDHWPGSFHTHQAMDSRVNYKMMTVTMVWTMELQDPYPLMYFRCQGLIVQLCMANRHFHTKFNSYQTTCYFFGVKIPKSTNKSYMSNVCSVTILSLIKSLYCSCSNNYGKRYNHDASSDVNDRSELCLSSSEL